MADEAEQAAAAAAPTTAAPADKARPRPAAVVLDPQLFMAARRGDSKQLKDLLLLE